MGPDDRCAHRAPLRDPLRYARPRSKRWRSRRLSHPRPCRGCPESFSIRSPYPARICSAHHSGVWWPCRSQPIIRIGRTGSYSRRRRRNSDPITGGSKRSQRIEEGGLEAIADHLERRVLFSTQCQTDAAHICASSRAMLLATPRRGLHQWCSSNPADRLRRGREEDPMQHACHLWRKRSDAHLFSRDRPDRPNRRLRSGAGRWIGTSGDFSSSRRLLLRWSTSSSPIPTVVLYVRSTRETPTSRGPVSRGTRRAPRQPRRSCMRVVSPRRRTPVGRPARRRPGSSRISPSSGRWGSSR